MGLSLLASSVQSGATEGCKQTGSALFSLYVLGELVGGGERAFCFSLCNVELYLFAGDNKQRVFGEGGGHGKLVLVKVSSILATFTSFGGQTLSFCKAPRDSLEPI